MTTNKLSSKFCDHATPDTHFDGDGLYLLVQADGKKYWRMACYLNGKRKLLAFGSYPKTSLIQAREERSKAQALLAQGIDPVQHAKQQKQEQLRIHHQAAADAGNTFEQIAKRLHANKAGKTNHGRPMSEAAVCQALDRMGYRMVGHGIRGSDDIKRIIQIPINIGPMTQRRLPKSNQTGRHQHSS